MKRGFVVAAALAAVAVGVGTAIMATRWTRVPPALERATLLDSPRPLPALSLIDQSGRDFGLERLHGRWTLMFFGFTHCPDVCPTTLAELAQARRMLADLPRNDQPQVVLVSVDPERDTPAALATYLGHFDPEFLGVTGSAGAVTTLTRDLGVAAMPGPSTDSGAYAVAHTAAIFLIDPSAAFAAVLGSPPAADVIARDYRTIVAWRR